MLDSSPKVSVVMPVYNALPYIDAAIESVLSQTYEDFEFVILDDASTDGSNRRLRYWREKDRRIRLIEVTENLGPARSSNAVARAAAAPIVVRTDADDLSYPERLSQQLEVLETHLDVGVVGGMYDWIDSADRLIRRSELWRLHVPSVFPPFGNGTLMYRRQIFERVGGYREDCVFWEDLDLIVRMAKYSRVMVIPHAIYAVRVLETSTRLVSRQERVENQMNLLFRARTRLEQGRCYDDILNTDEIENKLDPRVFLSLGAVVLLAGGRPRLFGRLLRRGALACNLRSAKVLLWTAWATLHPPSLRSLLRLLAAIRDFRFQSSRPRAARELVEWFPPTRASPIASKVSHSAKTECV